MAEHITMRAYPHPHDPTVCVVDRLEDGVLVATWNVPWSERPIYANAR